MGRPSRARSTVRPPVKQGSATAGRARPPEAEPGDPEGVALPGQGANGDDASVWLEPAEPTFPAEQAPSRLTRTPTRATATRDRLMPAGPAGLARRSRPL